MNNWFSDNGDGTYTNPILYTDYSDPDVIRVGEDYFMTASSFCNTPGLPVLHSKDLVNWKVISYALDTIPYERYETPQHGCGVWAPAIRYHEGEFIIFFPMPDEGIFVVKTRDPWGEWSKPYPIFEGKGWIDPCPFWDDDGKAYLVCGVAKSRIGYKSVLHLAQMTPECDRLLEKEHRIFDGNLCGQETIEGPKLYKRNGYYYIFAPAGGVKQGWQVVLRSKDIYGPYEVRKVCEQKDTRVNGPHQGAWIDTPSGEDWFIHFQDVYAAGRIIHLQPMKWVDDWPVIGAFEDNEECGKPVITCQKPVTMTVNSNIYAPVASDEFDADSLGLQWQWNANYHKEWYECLKEQSKLRLFSIQKADTISNQPNLLLQKWNMPELTATVKCDISNLADGDLTGMINMGVNYGCLAVYQDGNKKALVTISGKQTFFKEQATAEDEWKTIDEDISGEICGGTVYFQYRVTAVPSMELNQDGPFSFPIPKELVTLSVSSDGKNYRTCLEMVALAGRWVGVKEGMFICNRKGIKGGFLDLDYFRVDR